MSYFSETRTIASRPMLADLQVALTDAGIYTSPGDFITSTGDEYAFVKDGIWTEVEQAQLDATIVGLVPTPVGTGGSLTVAIGRWLDNSRSTILGAETPEALSSHKLWAVVFSCDTYHMFDQVSLEVTRAGGIGLGRIGLYSYTGSGFPGSLIVEASSTFSTSSTGTKDLPMKVILNPGLYFLCAIHNSVSPISVTAFSSVGAPLFLGWPTSTTSSCQTVIEADQTYGPLPSTFPVIFTYSSVCPPRFALRVAS